MLDEVVSSFLCNIAELCGTNELLLVSVHCLHLHVSMVEQSKIGRAIAERSPGLPGGWKPGCHALTTHVPYQPQVCKFAGNF